MCMSSYHVCTLRCVALRCVAMLCSVMFSCNHFIILSTDKDNVNVTVGLLWLEKAIALKAKQSDRSNVDDPVFRKPVKQWSDADVDILLNSRCRTNPPTFRHIADQINLMNRTAGVEIDREFNAKDCQNKWDQMFPTSDDANKAVAWLTALSKSWPGLYFQTESAPSSDGRSPPCLTAIYIVWPWSRELLKVLAPSIFCDASFNITVFNYKVVFITTLDGNKQHRPLMCSFILRSVAGQWAKIFQIFYLHGGATDCEPVLYVVTTDKEKAIRAGTM